MYFNDSPYRDKHLKKQVEVLVGQARAGDVLAANTVLRNAMTALSHVIDGNSTNTAGIESLKFLHDCIRGFLVDEIPLERSFCIEKSDGAPKKDSRGEALFLVLKVDDEIDRQVSCKVAINVSDAIRKATTKINTKKPIAKTNTKIKTKKPISIATVEAAWQLLGGLNGYRERPREFPIEVD